MKLVCFLLRNSSLCPFLSNLPISKPNMSENVQVDELALAHAADTEYLVRRGMGKGYQLLSLATPPIYAAFVLARKGRSHFSINRFLRATWVGGAAGALSQCRLNIN